MQTVFVMEEFKHGAEGLHSAEFVIDTALPIKVALDMLAQRDQAHGVGVEAAEGILVVKPLVVCLENESLWGSLWDSAPLGRVLG